MPVSCGYNSQIIGRVENAVPFHAEIPRIGGRYFDLLFGALLQEYLHFPYEYSILILTFEGEEGFTLVNFILQTTPEEKNPKKFDSVKQLTKY
jgi:hypothetical protein